MRSETGGALELDGAPLLSRTLVEVQVVGGGWVTGLLLWSGREREAPVFRMLLTGVDGGPPTPVDVPLPASVAIRRSTAI